MSPDNRLVPPEDSTSETLQLTISELIDIPSENDIKKILNASYIPPEFQNNPYMVQISSPTHGHYSLYLPGIHGDMYNRLPDILRKEGRNKIIPYRSSHEGLINIIHPPWSSYGDIAVMDRIDIYSKFQASDLPSNAPFKRVTFPLVNGSNIPHSTKTVGRNAHHFAICPVINDSIKLYGFNVDGYHLSPQEEQIEELFFWKNGEPFSLCFRPEAISYRAEHAYQLLRESSSPFSFQEN